VATLVDLAKPPHAPPTRAAALSCLTRLTLLTTGKAYVDNHHILHMNPPSGVKRGV
jgi:hypothetical protein